MRDHVKELYEEVDLENDPQDLVLGLKEKINTLIDLCSKRQECIEMLKYELYKQKDIVRKANKIIEKSNNNT